MRYLLLLALLAACGQGETNCVSIASRYHDAFAVAIACDPAGSACTEQRPMTMAEGSTTEDAKITGLCFVGGAGYVTAEHASALDSILGLYQGAGCAVSRCPGLPNNNDRCLQNEAGKYTCGGL